MASSFEMETRKNVNIENMASEESEQNANLNQNMQMSTDEISEACMIEPSTDRTDSPENVKESVSETQPSTATSSTADQCETQDTSGQTEIQPDNCDNMETVTFKVIYNKQKYDVTFPLDKTILNLKDHINELTSVPSSMQKIMYKGLAKDESTLRDLKVVNGAKVMVVGSTMNDILAVAHKPSQKEIQEAEKASASKEPLSLQKQHKKVLDKYGKPDDVLPGIKNSKQPLPPQPLTGMYNKAGGKVRLTFKLELDQIWLGTKERTEKLTMSSIKAVVSEPMAGHEEYHLMALQLGPTEASRYWIYWVPAQYTDAIKDTVLGKWQYF